MLLQKLRTETVAEHATMEKALDLLGAGFTLAHYVGTLQAFEAFVGAWEALGQQFCPVNMRAAFLARQRHWLLVKDVEHFGVPALPMRPAMPSFDRPGSFLGAMYVMEGSTLGGQLIAKHLEKTFALSDCDGYSFFRGRGGETVRIWKDFCRLLEAQSEELDTEAVVTGAREMFTAFREWVTSCRNDCEKLVDAKG